MLKPTSDPLEIPLSRLHIVFDVRRAPETSEARERRDNRILDFAEKMEAGERFPPVVVTRVDRFPGNMWNDKPPGDYIVIDGRTRYAAMEVNAKEGEDPLIECTEMIFKRVIDVETFAFRANYATAEPMTHQETADMVKKLWEQSLKEKAIHAKTGIPVGQIIKIIAGMREDRLHVRQDGKQRLHQALQAVKSGGSPDEVAKRFDVELPQLRQAMLNDGRVSVSALKAGLMRSARVYMTALTAACARAVDAYQLGKITESEFHDFMESPERVLATIQRKTTEARRSVEQTVNA